ncbi:MAG: hypothetical protein GY849_18420, partial [Deltaproteobacteria bacterium]|nr:hypothetical protein [Deltaproteobacteria bacterium]
RGLDDQYPERISKVPFLSPFGVSGIAGGLGLAAALLDKNAPPCTHALVLTTARGGINAASLAARSDPGFMGGC